MAYDLGVCEIRVLGSLVEKSTATPEQYPLTINALVQACNQKSARDPVMALAEADVREAVDALVQRGWVRQASQAGARVSRFAHRLGDRPGSALRMEAEPLAALCVLMLCGPQTPGQIRTRARRLAAFANTDAVEAALTALADHRDGPLAERLPRDPGKREHRWRHLLDGAEPAQQAGEAPAAARARAEAPAGQAGWDALEARVAELERVVERLQGGSGGDESA
jgi:uncharacterized protein YceH (UPF0502 family)